MGEGDLQSADTEKKGKLMDGLILGLDLCDAYTQLVCDQGERSWTLPTVICRKKEEESWMVGEPAYASALAGDGVMVSLTSIPCQAQYHSTLALVTVSNLFY